MFSTLLVGVLCLAFFCYAILSVLSCIAIILTKKRELTLSNPESDETVIPYKVWAQPLIFYPYRHFTNVTTLFNQVGQGGAGCIALIAFLISCDCWSIVALPHHAVGWSAVCDCDIA